jgi:hypothetical protein
MVKIAQWNAGAVTVAGDTGVDVRSRGGLMDTNGQYAQVTLHKVATDEWLLTGDRASQVIDLAGLFGLRGQDLGFVHFGGTVP